MESVIDGPASSAGTELPCPLSDPDDIDIDRFAVTLELDERFFGTWITLSGARIDRCGLYAASVSDSVASTTVARVPGI